MTHRYTDGFRNWFIFGGVRKIGQSRKSAHDIPWYKQSLLTGGMASLLFGLCSWLTFLASFLPGFLRNSSKCYKPPFGLSQAEYDRQMQGLLSLITARSGLPLYDLRKQSSAE